jgi:hypothetical protein
MDCAEKRRTVRFFKDTKMHGRIFVSEIPAFMLSKKICARIAQHREEPYGSSKLQKCTDAFL